MSGANDLKQVGRRQKVTLLSTQLRRYRELVGAAFGVTDLEKAAGFSIDQLVRVDLEADGVDEVLFSAQQTIGLRRVVGDQVATVLLPEPRPEADRWGTPAILGFWDSDSDGRLEVLVGSGDPLAGVGPQWIGYWLVSANPGSPPALLASSGCVVEGPPKPWGHH